MKNSILSVAAYWWNRLLAKLYIPMTYRHWHGYRIRSCPYCGGEAMPLKVYVKGNPRRAVACVDCHLISPAMMTDDQAIYAWNHLRRIELEEGEA